MFLELWNRLESRLRRRNVEREMDAEMRFHLEMQIERNVAAGMRPDDARRAALREFGGAEQMKEACRDARHTWLDALWQDVRYALRSFRRDRAFTLTAVFTLALGIGATTSTYSIVDGTLFKPLPYDKPDRIVMLMGGDPTEGRLSETLGFEEAAALHRAHAFAAVADYALSSVPVKMLDGPKPETVSVVGVSPEFFRVLNVSPFLGRAFADGEGSPGKPMAVLLSYGFWQRRFGGDRSVVGRTLTLSSDQLPELSGPVTVAGVLPATFTYPRSTVTVQPNLVAPFPVEWDKPAASDNRYVLLGRLKDGVTLREAQAEASAIAGSMAPVGPRKVRPRMAVRPLRTQMVAYYYDTLLTVMGAVLFLLLIACVNVANLMMARGRSREREFAIRSSLGAGRGRIVRQLLTESALLALIGAAVGVLVSYWTFDALLAQVPRPMRLIQGVGIDMRVLSFAALLTLGAVAIFGGIPALDASRPDLMTSLKIGPRARRSRGAGRARGVLLSVEVAMALVLLVGAGLLVNSFVRLQRIDLGFDPANLLATRVSAPEDRYPDNRQANEFIAQVCDRVRGIPGVTGVGTADTAPLEGALFGSTFTVENSASPERGDAYRVSPGYFETLGMPAVAGRLLTATDEQGPPMAVINEALAGRHWTATGAIGRAIVVGKDLQVRVVGVVPNIRSQARTPAKPTVYLSYDASYRRTRSRSVIVRTLPGRNDLKGAIMAAVRELDPDLQVSTKAVTDWLAATTTSPRFYVLIYGAFAGIGLLLATVGIAGVAAHNVLRRTQEIGVRLALGGTGARVVGMVARQALRPIVIGTVVGLAGAAILTRTLTQLLFDIEPHDPLTYAMVVALLGAVALVATWLPARRAARVNPIDVLRAE